MIAQRRLDINSGPGADRGKRWFGGMDDRSPESGALFPPRRKRRADDSLDGEQRLSKRFNLLNLGLFCTVACSFS